MFKSLILALGFMVSVSANATNITNLVHDINSQILSDIQTQGVFNWKVGDTTSYSIDMSIIKGTMVMAVKDVQADAVTFTQDMDLGFAGKQACEMIINPNTGETKKMTCNGQDQSTDGAGEIEVVDQKEDTVTVPAGTFTCLYIKAKQKKDGSIVEQWINPKLIPVLGMAKTIAPSQFGPVTIALTSFKRM
jgi:hypothetical protein